jgi:predicted phosphodiesterase
MRTQRSVVAAGIALLAAIAAGAQPQLTVPNRPDSLKFGVIGDNGDGDSEQYEVGEQMAAYHNLFPFEFVIMLGDNMYGSQKPRDFKRKFEVPYKVLLDRKVEFYASLGNHDEPENRFYELWNMKGQRYYTFEKKNARFFVLDTAYLDREQIEWLERELKASNDDWKIAYFHHPLYSSGGRHGSEEDLQKVLEPLFIQYGVNVVFQGHDHIYERLAPQKGIYYFVEGASGKLRRGDLEKTGLTAAGNDQDQSFMIVEIDDDTMWFQAISRTGKTIDSGSIARQKRTAPERAPAPSSR